MSRFNTQLRISRCFPAIASIANTFAYQHKNSNTLVVALSYQIREFLSAQTDKEIFSAASVMVPDLVLPTGKTLRDGIIDALTLIAVKDTAAFCGKEVNVNEPLQGQSQYRVVVDVEKNEEAPVVQGKSFEEMQALLAEQGEDGCAGGGCKI